jgi:hypothetical protein
VSQRTIDELLGEADVFDGLGPAQLELIAGCGRIVAF